MKTWYCVLQIMCSAQLADQCLSFSFFFLSPDSDQILQRIDPHKERVSCWENNSCLVPTHLQGILATKQRGILMEMC